MYRECRHILANGSRCHAVALEKMPYCYYHHRLHRAIHGQKTSETWKKTLDLHPLEDRASILMALSEVICGLAAGRIDSGDAGRLIYGLQVAGQHAVHGTYSEPDDAIEFLVRSEDDQEFAPEEFHCSSDEEDEDDDDSDDEDDDGSDAS
jgi:hypothetical protein